MTNVTNVANVADTNVVDSEARGILLSLVAMDADESVGESALDRLDEKRRAACVGAWRKLHRVGEAERGQILAEWRAEAASPLPRGLCLLHPSWILAALEGEPRHILRMVLDELPEPLRAAVLPGIAHEAPRPAEATEVGSMGMKQEVARVAFAWLALLCESEGGPEAERLCALAFDDLRTEVIGRGARAVGQSLAGAAPALRARAMAAAGEPWAQTIGKVSAEGVSDADRKSAMAHANVRMPDSARTPSDRLFHIGLAVLKSELAVEPPGSLFRVAGRLPAAQGRLLIGW